MQKNIKALYIADETYYKVKVAAALDRSNLKDFTGRLLEEGLKQREDIKKYQNNMAKVSGSEVT